MTVTIKSMHAGQGVDYLLRTVAAGDGDRSLRDPLTRYYAEDIAFILDAVPSENSGLTLCTGSLGAGAHNDVPAIARRFADRIAR